MSGIHLRHWPGDADRPGLALHPMMGSGAVFDRMAAALGPRLDLRGFDMPGHGRSGPWEGGEVDYHTAVTRVAASMIERPLDLIGHSMGATVALRIAVAAPEAVRSLTLIEPVLFAAAPDPAQDALDARLAELLAMGEDQEAARVFLSAWGLPGMRVGPEAAAQIRLVAETGPTLREDAARILRPGGLEAIDAPVLLIQGAESPPVIGAIAEVLAARLSDVGRAVVPGASHMLPLTHAAEVAGLVGVNLDRA